MSTTQNKDKALNLTGPTDKTVDADARERLLTARISLLINNPFFGTLATRMEIVNADSWLSTLATDGKHFYYNSRFVMMLKEKEVEFGFGHEILHCVYDHMGRRNDRHHQIWNIANDYCVNADLVKHNIGKKITTIDILFDTQYNGMTSETIYDLLMKNVTMIDMNALLDKLLDEHLEPNDGDNDGNSNDDRPKISAEDMKEIQADFQAAVINAAGIEGDNTKIPNNVKKLISDLTKPEMDWTEMLDNTMTAHVKEDVSFRRPSRKGWNIDAILPGAVPGNQINCAVAIDTSGSISKKMLTGFLSEVQGIMEQFTQYNVHVFCFDTSVHNPRTFTSDDINEISEYNLGGFGGTDFAPIFNHMKTLDEMPDSLIVFSDGYPFGSWGDDNLLDTLWVLHGTKSIVAPFGDTVYFKDEANAN